MKPRSAAVNERMTVPLSITLATFSSPCVNLMWSTLVSMRRERAQHVLDRHARRERRVALRVERLGAGHAARHPQHDHRVGGGLRPAPGACRAQQLRLAPDERRERRGGRRAHEAAAAQLRVDQALFAGQTSQFVLPSVAIVCERCS